MKIHRFYLKEKINLVSPEVRNPELIHQIKTVLKLQIGEQVVLIDNNSEILTEIFSINDDCIRFKYISKKAGFIKDKFVTLYCSIIKRDNFELVVQKATEVGVDKIVPIITERTVKLGLKLERLKKIIEEAVEQSGRTNLPEVIEPIKFQEVLQSAKENDQNYFFDITGNKAQKFEGKKIGLFIGPEGGWSEIELSLAKTNEFDLVKLSETTLRAETAAIVASFLACNN